MKVNEINNAILTGTLTNEDLNSIIQAIKFKRSQVANTIKFQLKAGDAVTYDGRYGQTRGIIEKVNVKKAIVNVNGMKWNVPLNMLTVV
jgi:hypothetical protein